MAKKKLHGTKGVAPTEISEDFIANEIHNILKEDVENLIKADQNLAKQHYRFEAAPILDFADLEINRLRNEIEDLKKIIASYEQDGMYALFFALNRKGNEIAMLLNDAKLSMNSDDKAFDRFLKLIEKIDYITSSLDKLRRDYLKLDDDKLKEVETKGIPLIERRNQSKKAR